MQIFFMALESTSIQFHATEVDLFSLLSFFPLHFTLSATDPFLRRSNTGHLWNIITDANATGWKSKPIREYTSTLIFYIIC